MSSSNGKEGAAAAVPSSPEQAERFLRAATTAQEARRIYIFCSEQEDDWRAIKLIAFRRCGELLGPAETGPPKGSRNAAKNNVSDTHVILSDGDRDFRRRARQVAAVPQEQFDEYLREEPKPTRAGLLKKTEPAKAAPGKPKKQGPSLAGKRRHQAKMGRVEARRNGRPLGFWEIGWDVSRLVYALAGWPVEEADLSEENVDTMLSVEEDLLYLYDWMDDTVSLIHSRLGEQRLRGQLRKLEAKTVENGCTVEEADAATRAAARLRRKINNRLVSVA